MQDRSLLDYWLILSQRRFVIYLVVLTALAGAFLVGFTMEPIYEARASLFIPVEVPKVSYLSKDPTSLARQAGTPMKDEDAYKPYVGILKSLRLAEDVHAQFPQKAVVKLMRSDVDFEVTDEFIIRVYSRDPDPVLAADVANAYVKGLAAILAESSQAQVLAEPRYLEEAMRRVKNDLQVAEANLKRFEQKHHIASLDTELTELTKEKTSLEAKRGDTAVLIGANAGKQKALLQEFEREGESIAQSDVTLTSPLIEHLRVQLTDLLTRLAEAQAEFGKKNLEVVVLLRRKQELEDQLRAEIGRWAGSRIKPGSTHLETLRHQLIDALVEASRLEATSRGYVKSLERVNERLRHYPEVKAQWTNLNDAAVQLRGVRQQLLVSMTEASLQSSRDMHLIVPLDRAEPPQGRAFPIWWLNLFVALVAGLLAGIGYAFFLNYLEETRQVRTARLVHAILRSDQRRGLGMRG